MIENNQDLKIALEARTWPNIIQDDIESVVDVLESGLLYSGKGGPRANLLEEEWGDYCKVPKENVLAVSSCTAAIHLALVTLGIGPGDEVITTALTFSGTSHPICYTGATPVFVDVDSRTFNIDPSKISQAITKRTRAILPVHLHGLMADMPAIQKIAKENNLFIVEDACQSHGSQINGKMAGTWGDAGCFSLSESKSLTGGQGGFIIFRDNRNTQIARNLRNYGEKPVAEGDRDYTSFNVGFNYVLPEIPAALASSQLKRLDTFIHRANENAQILSEHLQEIPGITVPYVPQGYTHIFHKYRILLDSNIWFSPRLGAGKSRDTLIDHLRSKNVPATTWQVTPVSEYPVFKGLDSRLASTARYILDHSIILGDEHHPLAIQNKEIVTSWVDVFKELYNALPSIWGTLI